jgi:rhodanese-related sulfurtransferase/DNA-binding transcriptional ArsR family regulator
MDHRAVKDRLYSAWAETAKALASPKRVELLDLLAQGERTVEALARETGLTINNTSSHLSVLKTARLVETRKEAQFVFHRLADDAVVALLREVQVLARRRLHEVDHLARTYLEGRDPLEPVDTAELRRRLRAGEVTVIDVRPALEYEAGHIGGALSVPLDRLDERLADLPASRPVVAYCRGPYCVYAIEAVERLRQRGYDARRLADGLPDWRLAGHPVVAGAEGPSAHQDVPPRRPPTSPRRRAP